MKMCWFNQDTMKKILQILVLCVLLLLLAIFAAPTNIFDLKYYRAFAYSKIMFYNRAQYALNQLPREALEKQKYRKLQKKIDAGLNYFKALDYYDQGKYEEALILCSEALQIEPNSASYIQQCGLAALKMKEYDMAIAYLSKNTGSIYKGHYLHNNLAYAYYCKGDILNAIHYVNKAIEIKPKNSYSYSLKGKILDELHDYEKALQCYSIYERLEPKARKKPRWEYKSYSGIENEDKDIKRYFSSAKEGRRLGYLETVNYTEVIKPQYVGGGDFHEGVACVYKDHKWAYINKSGEYINNDQYDSNNNCVDGIIIVENDGKYRFLKKDGKYLNETLYSMVYMFSEGLAAVKVNDKWGYIDRFGNTVIDTIYDSVEHFSEGLASVQQGEKWGYIENSGRFVISPAYDGAASFHEGLACVKIGKKWGFIDKNNKIVIDPQFKYASYFRNGLSIVGIGSGKCYIDNRGNRIIEGPFTDAWQFEPEGFAFVKINNKYGVVNRKGEMIIEPRYDSVATFIRGIIKVTADGRTQYLDKNLKPVDY